jgi:uncharacterized membrane protein
MGEYLSWGELVLIFIVLFGIQLITRIKGVTDGMLFKQIMMDSNIEANEIIKMIKKQQDKIKNKKEEK